MQTRTAADCPTCSGSGHVSCCQSAENGIFGGPHGCRCRGPSRPSCEGCDGTGQVYECARCGSVVAEDESCRRCAEDDEEEAMAQTRPQRRSFAAGITYTLLVIGGFTVYGFAVYGFLAWWRS